MENIEEMMKAMEPDSIDACFHAAMSTAIMLHVLLAKGEIDEDRYISCLDCAKSLGSQFVHKKIQRINLN